MNKSFLKLLVIDDNPDNLLSIKALICDLFLHVEVFMARDGISGIAIAKQEDPSVIFLDIHMPKLDGFEVCQKIKEDDQLAIIPVVFVTALETNKETRIKALQVGAEGFLSKPIDELELMAQIKAMVKIKDANMYHRIEKEKLSTLVRDRTEELEIELEKRKNAENTLRSLNVQLQQNQSVMLNLMEDMQNEIESRKRLESELESSLKKEKKQTYELELLLEGAKSILQDREFNLTAKKHFDLLKKITGAASGYVMLSNNQHPEKELAFFQSENMPFDIQKNTPLVSQSLKSVVLNSNKITYENDFKHSHWGKSLPKGHIPLRNALYSPLIMENKVVGLICLI
ncbi:MAG: response regulator, partial [Caldisericia bacterium]|nr:response regulator [Caldisericia bacterium]